jgi:hypothetical protein
LAKQAWRWRRFTPSANLPAARKRKLAGKETKNFYALAEIRKIHAA